MVPMTQMPGSRRSLVGAVVTAAVFLLTTLLVGLGVPTPADAAVGQASGDPDAADFATVAALDELTEEHAHLFRLYWASFGRPPDAEGALYWIGQQDRCLGLDAIAALFADSQEFGNRYGVLDDDGFVERIYRNVLGRPADADGAAYWTDLLSRGVLNRGGVVLNVSLSSEFTRQHQYPSDGVPARSCQRADGVSMGRSVHVLAQPAERVLATVAGLTLTMPAAIVERVGFHQSSHPGAIGMTAPAQTSARTSVMESRGRGTHRQGAADVAVEPATEIVAPISGTVARAGSYTLYCRYRDGFVVINPDGRPDLEVKVLHIQGVSVRAGQRVEVGQVIATNATPFPFQSQIDRLTAEPSWPHVHIEVVDPSVPRRPSSGSC